MFQHFRKHSFSQKTFNYLAQLVLAYFNRTVHSGFHNWLDELLRTEDKDLRALFERRRAEDEKYNPYSPQVSAG